MKRYIRSGTDNIESKSARQYNMLTDVGKQIYDVIDDLYGVWMVGSNFTNCDVITSQESFIRSEAPAAANQLRDELQTQGLLGCVVRVDYFASIPYTDKPCRVSVVIKKQYSNGNIA